MRSRDRIAVALVALVVPAGYVLLVSPTWTEPHFGSEFASWTGLAVFWVCALVAVTMAGRASGRGLAWLPLPRPTVRTVLLAVATGVGLMLSVPLLAWLATALLGSAAVGSIGDVAAGTAMPLLVAAIITAAVTEELLYRVVAIEVVAAGRPWLGVVLGLTAFTVVHAGGWNAAHVVGVVLPLGLALSLLYLWRRDLTFVVLVHGIVDLPLLVLALGA